MRFFSRRRGRARRLGGLRSDKLHGGDARTALAVAGTVLVTAAALRTRTACTQLAQNDRSMQAYAVRVDMDERARDSHRGLFRALLAFKHTSKLLSYGRSGHGPSSWVTLKGHGS